jgi:ribosomal 50S subunit-associated protein YjgA (DUF615 family)
MRSNKIPPYFKDLFDEASEEEFDDVHPCFKVLSDEELAKVPLPTKEEIEEALEEARKLHERIWRRGFYIYSRWW